MPGIRLIFSSVHTYDTPFLPFLPLRLRSMLAIVVTCELFHCSNICSIHSLRNGLQTVRDERNLYVFDRKEKI